MWDSINNLLQRNIHTVLFLIAIFQCLTIWNYQGDNVDESEIVHYAVGFLGGDLDPAWFGYGTLGMYILAFLYTLFGLIILFLGVSESWIDYGSMLFDSGIFFVIARLLFAFFGVLAVYFYYRGLRKVGLPRYALLPFLVVGLFGTDSLKYANYIRTDQLVSLALSGMFFLLVSEQEFTFKRLLLMTALAAAAVSAKISSLPFSILLVCYFLIRNVKERENLLKWFLVTPMLFLFFSFCFQPYQSVFSSLYEVYQTRLAGDSTFNFGKKMYVGFIDHFIRIYEILKLNLSLEVLLLLVLSPFFYFQNSKLFGLLFLILVSYIFPYFFHWEVTDYWFIPVFPVVKLMSVLSIYYLVVTILKRFGPAAIRWIMYLVLVASSLQLISQYRSFSKMVLGEEMNREFAYKWTLYNIDTLLVDHYTHVLPKFYFGRDISTLKNVSRAFIFNRNWNEYLNECFIHFLDHRDSVLVFEKDIRKVKIIDPDLDLAEKNLRVSRYFMTAPNIYNRFLNNEGLGYSKNRYNELLRFKKYYSWMLSGELVKRFDKGSGPVVELWRLPDS